MNKEFWKNWKPTARTCLCFVLRGEEVLLIRKKRGSGAGMVNAPGGHLESGESAQEAALREVEEEVRVSPYGLQEMGELSFQFVERGKSLSSLNAENLSEAMHCVVFTAAGYHGEPQETEEAVPFWCHHSQIPYHEMWEDDQEWIPGMLQGKKFAGYYFFDQEKMLAGSLDWKNVGE
ncbi:MAG: 8-oxo-dGTP diphosphatase [Chthoniobacterales bacterium]|nr:8-oxo-dGTP diphosphatase [Chthoniobacterales bacterium]